MGARFRTAAASLLGLMVLGAGCQTEPTDPYDFDDEGGAAPPSTDGTTTTSVPPDGTDEGGDSTGAVDPDSGSSDSGGEVEGDPPTAVADAYALAQTDGELTVLAAAGVLANDLDPDGVGLTVESADAHSLMSGDVAVDPDGGFVYSPTASYWGDDSFTYTLGDGGQTAEVTLLVRPVAVPLAHVAVGRGGFAINGEATGDFSGTSVGVADDMDGDARPELLIGAFGADPNGGVSGRGYVLHEPDQAQLSLTQVVDGNGGFALDGAAATDLTGEAIAGAGDVNGDGIGDVIIGARGSDSYGVDAGRAYVVFGKDDGTIVSLSEVAGGLGGFVIEGEQAQDLAGFAVSRAGDLDGDGLDDVAIGAISAPAGSDRGRLYVVYGKTDPVAVALEDIANGIGGFAISGEEDDDRFGYAVDSAGDVDGDGQDDLIVGALGASGGGPGSGRAYVLLAPTGAVDLADIVAGVGGFVLDGESIADKAGSDVAGAGDINGDGRDDLIVGALESSAGGVDSGRVYVVFGTANPTSVSLTTVAAGSGGFAIEATAGDQIGSAVSGAGDMNGDGLADVILGGQLPDASGRAWVVYGKATTDPVVLADMDDGLEGFALLAEYAGDQAGRAVSGVGDLDGDALSDVILGAPDAGPFGSFSGRSYVVYGSRTVLP